MLSSFTMFKPKTAKIRELAQNKTLGATTQKLEQLLTGKVNVYVDFANVRPWSEKLKWHINVGRLKQFLDSFDNVESVKWYQGELVGEARSEKEIRKLKKSKYIVRTKPVKVMRLSIDATSVS